MWSRIFAPFVLILISSHSFALEVYLSPVAREPMTLIYSENKEWIVQKIGRAADGWPDLIFDQHFSDSRSARLALQNVSPRGSLKSNTLPERELELKGKRGEVLWTVKEQWSVEWERRYANWVREELNEEWWRKHNIHTDCADVAYSARWIFARIHGLPMANRLASGEWFTHNSVRSAWLKLPTANEWHKDQRFLAALNYLLDYVFTHSLWNDSYPIRITPDSLLPGVHHLHLHGTSGHTQFVWKTSTRPDEIPIMTLSSTVPRQNRLMMSNIFFGQRADSKGVAFQRMRWPVWNGDKVSLVSKTEMPDYSEEQFDPDFVHPPRAEFWQEVFFRLNPNLNLKITLQKGLAQLEAMLLDRAQVVDDGYALCRGGKCPLGSALYENWSTPSRDMRISSTIWTLSILQSVSGVNDQELNSILNRVILRQQGLEFTVRHVRNTWESRWYSSDPNDDPLLRWGLHPAAHAQTAIEAVKAGLHQRELFLKKPNPCVGGECTMGSPDYIAASSFGIDRSLKAAASRVNNYCFVLLEFCNDLKTELLKETATANQRRLDIWTWVQEIPLFNSDPRLPLPKRYHSQSGTRPYFIHPQRRWEPSNLKVFGNRVALTVEPQPKLYRIEGHQIIPWSFQGEEPVTLDTKFGYIWTGSGTSLRVRQIDHLENVKTIELTENWGHPVAFAGRILIRQGPVLRLLDGTGDEIKEVASFSGQYFNDQYNGIVSIEGNPNYTELLDLTTGNIVRTPRMRWILDIQKFENGLLIARFSGGADVQCMVIHGNEHVVLGNNDRCLWVDAQNSSAAFLVSSPNGDLNYIHRVYKDWKLKSETQVGAVSDATHRLIRLKDGRSFCLKTNGRVVLPPINGFYLDCNDSYHLATDDIGLRAIEAKTGIAFHILEQGGIEFVSSRPDEHYIRVSSYENQELLSEILDLEHLDQFSIFSQAELTGAWNSEQREGVDLYSQGLGIWIGDTITR